MGNTTAIEWTRSEDGTAGSTWNPVSGCTKLSPGCDHCYAENIAHRFSGTKAYPNGFDVTLWPARLDQPIRWTRPRKIFVNSTSDLFHKDIPDEYIAKVWAVMAATPRHTFQILTKRPARMRSLLRSSRFRRQVGDAARALDLTNDLVSIVDVAVQDLWPLENVWLGVSTEDQKWADIRIPELLATPAAVRFISAEPLLGPIELWLFLVPNANLCRPHGATSVAENAEVAGILRSAVHEHLDDCRTFLDWIIVGGESGPQARPMNPAWARSLRDQAANTGVAFLFKQWGEWAPLTGVRYSDFHEFSLEPAESVRKVGKKSAGRELDGRIWDEFPNRELP